MSSKIQSEAELVKLLASGLKRNFNTDIAVQEFAGGYGIADLVFAKNFLTNQNIIDRKPLNNYYALKSYLSLPQNKAFTLNDIVKASGGGKNIGSNVANILTFDDYISKHGKFYYKTDVPLVNPIKKLVAIEVKLRDWKQGILQARRYKSYTDECYLAILSRYEKNVDKHYLTQFGIGLILFNEENGEIWIKHKPLKKSLVSIYDEVIGLFAKELFLYESSTVQNLRSISFQV
ncbi:MAG: hypothetical protein WC775_00200 [Patescibacteria group bacterium]|jgi:hypothetical protein